ncbi:MAG TPA: cytochrome c biogenesis protein CcdA [Gemmatimonadaceae bacterium]|nr:cytochrome c biogenesis protein CcdA [Gemmatimonadaceae bacterium]
MLLPSDISTLLSSNPALALPAVFAGGVLTSLTPCIYPMIPITVSIVGGQTIGAGARAGEGEGAGAKQSKRRTVALTLSYVVGLALVYALLGLIAGLTGTLFGSISTNPWLYFAMANLLIVFALAMLDVLPVRVPQAVLRRASEAGRSGGVAGAFAMGAASGLVAAPCGAPVMAAVLTWVSLTKSALLGFIYLFVFSLGMTALLVAVGLSTGLLARLPRAGVWMIWIKRVFALLMLVVAEYYLIEMGKLLL